MRKPILAGNWKLNKTRRKPSSSCGRWQPKLTPYLAQVETVVCPPFVCLPAVADALTGVKIGSSAHRTCTGLRTALTPARSRPRC